MGNDNILIVVVLAVVAYLVLTAEKVSKSVWGASLFGATAETPAGTITSTGAAGAAREISKGSCLGYIFNPALFAACIAGKTTTVTQSPQTPAPTTIQKCPWDSNLLAGDIRCQNPTQSTVITGQPEIGYTECIVGAPVWDGGCP